MTEAIQHFFETVLSEEGVVFMLSLLPISEIRGGLIAARAYNMEWALAFIISFIGNVLPIPIILVFLKKVFNWMRRSNIPLLSRTVDWCLRKAEKNSDRVRKYKLFGLWLLVAIPLPGTGAWTGALVANVMDVRIKHSLPIIILGVAAAGVIMLTALYFLPAMFI